MPRFAYRAKDHTLRIVEGTLEAESETSAISHLGRDGMFPISVVEVRGIGRSGPVPEALRRVSARTLAYVTHQLADLLGGGLPLLSALTVLARQIEQPGLARVIESVANGVRDGRTFSEALADYPSVFPPLYRSMVKAGETGGGLERTLVRLAELAEQEAEMRSRIISASFYPLFILCFAMASTIFLMVYVIPKLSLVFVESGQVLPLPTQLLLWISHLLIRWGWLMLLLAGLSIWSFRQWRHSPGGRAIIDRTVMRIPAIGSLVRKIETARLARTLGVMLGQGVPVLQALQVVTANLSNVSLRAAGEEMGRTVRDGSSLAAAVTRTRQFPVFVSNMVAVGEESGTVDAALMKVASTYERDVERTFKALTTVLEPVLLLVVGGIVMFVVLSLLLPVFQIGLVMQ
ncbi:MAG: type II secretion system F family protein [Candidatus Omnitrophica bacterium]|nr:type II secretion system F family protein [Candidatus Omnitrophota bacterium]